MSDVSIINYGVGNISSIVNMLKRIGFKSDVVSSAQQIKSAKKLILPGVGSYDAAVDKILSTDGLKEELDRLVLERKIPILGICLGMQLLLNGSEEGDKPGLGYVDGIARRFNSSLGVKVPHMGWNYLKVKREHFLLSNLDHLSRYYFVHSYYVDLTSSQDCISTTSYGHEFCCGLSKGNISGFQFHPEKSHKFGIQILRNFVTHAN